jgi:hypothetical protein
MSKRDLIIRFLIENGISIDEAIRLLSLSKNEKEKAVVSNYEKR